MKIGDIVPVYQKPVTREAFEGEARIVRFLSKHPAGLFHGVRYYKCAVNFMEDSPHTVVTRLIGDEAETRYAGRRSGQGDTAPGTPDLNLETPED